MMTKEPLFTLTAGPVQASPTTLKDLSRPIVYDFDPYFLDFYERTTEKLRQAYDVATAPVILHGEAVLGLEAAAASLIGKNDVVLNLVSGVYGKGFGLWADRYNKELIEVEVDYDDAIRPEQVEEAFQKRPDISIVSVVHNDTPSGTINPVAEIGAVANRHGALLLVDAVSSFGGMKVDAEGWHADIIVVGPQKCLAGPPGLSLMYVSDRAWEHMAANPDAPRGSILSILDWKDAHKPEVPFPFTPSVTEIFALDSVLGQYLDEGPENVWRRHALTARATRRGIQAMGLDIWPRREEIAADSLTAVRIPEGVDGDRVLHVARQRYGVMFSTGRWQLMGKLLRIGHFGPVAHPMYAMIAVTAMGAAMREAGFAADIAAGVDAVMGVIGAAQAARVREAELDEAV